MQSEERRMENSIGAMLQYGVTLAAALVVAGGLLYLHREAGGGLPDYSHFPGVSSPLISVRTEWSRLAAGDASAVIGAGLLVLILTPVARVLMCIVGFVRERNWLYVLVSSIVMAVILYSVLHVR